MRTHRLRALLHFGDGLVTGAHQLFLIALAAAAEHVAQARAKILEHVHTGHHFAEDDALVVGDGVSVDRRGGGDEDHGEAPLAQDNYNPIRQLKVYLHHFICPHINNHGSSTPRISITL